MKNEKFNSMTEFERFVDHGEDQQKDKANIESGQYYSVSENKEILRSNCLWNLNCSNIQLVLKSWWPSASPLYLFHLEHQMATLQRQTNLRW